MGRDRFGMPRQLFDTEQLSPQRQLARAWTQALISGLPALKAQWQSLHVLLTIESDSCNQPRSRNSSCLAIAVWPIGPGIAHIMPNFGAGRLIKPAEKTIPHQQHLSV
jgi:hypothetical protein